MKKILIIGADGQLGKAISNYYNTNNINVEVVGTDIDEIDITDFNSVSSAILEIKPDIIINCAALTNVEECQKNPNKAYLVNTLGVKNISLVAQREDILLVHVSTDYVFSGDKVGIYNENDVPNPKSVYGETKLAGEKIVQEIMSKYFIVRTAWLFGDGANFVKTMLELSKSKSTIDVVLDQIGSPTSAEEVAKVIALLIDSTEYGIYHATCEGCCSWSTFATEIFRLSHLSTKVKPVTSQEYSSIVPRPKNSVLDNKKLREVFGYEMSTWEDAIKKYLLGGKKMEVVGAKKRVLVTGANGYVGRHVVKVLLDMGHNVLVADFSFNDVDTRAQRVTVPIFCGEENIYELLEKPDICIHLAWRNGFMHNADSHILDLPEHYTFIKNMINGGLPHLSVMGTMHEVGYWEGAIDEKTPTNPTSFYGISKNALREITMTLTKEKNVTLQWLRAYYIMGDDLKNNSIFSKLIKAESENQTTFPLNSGKNKYDFITVDELARQIATTSIQTEVVGTINCCTGNPVSLGNKVEEFIENNNFKIKPKYGAFPDREYDSPEIWGDAKKIKKIMG